VYKKQQVPRKPVSSIAKPPSTSPALGTRPSVQAGASTEGISVADTIARTKHLLTAVQLGALLELSPKTISAWAKQGRIPFIRIGSALRFEPKAVAFWLTARSSA